MTYLIVYGRFFGDVLLKTFVGISKNLWTLLLPMLLLWVAWALGDLLAPLGFAGGLLLGLARSALLSSYLYFLSEVVVNNRVSITEFKKSIGTYFWSVVNLFFVLWIVDLVLMATVPAGAAMQVDFGITLLVFGILPSLEVIYLRGSYGGIATLQQAFAFLEQSWIEWLCINLPLGLLIYQGRSLLITSYLLHPFLLAIGLGAVIHLVMVFRGVLFKALSGSSHRQRMYKYRMNQ